MYRLGPLMNCFFSRTLDSTRTEGGGSLSWNSPRHSKHMYNLCLAKVSLNLTGLKALNLLDSALLNLNGSIGTKYIQARTMSWLALWNRRTWTSDSEMPDFGQKIGKNTIQSKTQSVSRIPNQLTGRLMNCLFSATVDSSWKEAGGSLLWKQFKLFF